MLQDYNQEVKSTDMEKNEQNLLLVYDTARAYAERTLGNFWEDLSPTEQRKEIEQYKDLLKIYSAYVQVREKEDHE